MNNDTQAVIIGGGPAGLSAAIYLARANIKPLVFAGAPSGGQLMLTTEIENFPGAVSITGPELIERMRYQADSFGAMVVDANVTSITSQAEKIEIISDSAEYPLVKTKTLLIATGAKALWLGLDSETRLRGKGVSACATCDGFFFRNKEVAVIGGGDTALEEALHLTKFASKVYIVHRRDEFRASTIMSDRVLAHEKIEVLWNKQVLDIQGTTHVEGLTLKDTKNAQSVTLGVSGIFVAIGHKPDTELFGELVERDEKGYILTFASFAQKFVRSGRNSWGRFQENILETYTQSSTSHKGVFAAGDCVDSRYRQAATAAGMGVGAALDMEAYIDSLKEV